jgi:hypothetical protein
MSGKKERERESREEQRGAERSREVKIIVNNDKPNNPR